MAQNGLTAQGGSLELLSPAIVARSYEPEDSDGSEYQVEMLAQLSGSSEASNLQRLAACTVIIGAPIGRNKVRIVDGKIENLWLKDGDSGNRLDNVRVLATLMGYVQKVCSQHGVPHLSSIQKVDHPAWLRDFFPAAGFNRCECLKPEAGGQRHRACIKLSSSGLAIEQNHTQVTPESQAGPEDNPVKDSERPLINAQSSNASASTTSAKPSLSTNGTNGSTGSSKLESIVPKPMSESQALEWLNQNKEILSPPSASSKSMKALETESSHSKASLETAAAGNSSNREVTGVADRKRKREASVLGSQRATLNSNGTQGQTKQDQKASESKTTPDQPNGAPKSKLSPKPKTAKLPSLRYSSTIIPPALKPTPSEDGQVADDTSMTDAILALCNKPASKASPKQIKKEASSTVTASSPPRDPYAHNSPNMPASHLTCYYWYTQGMCTKSDRDCMYAHWDTGHVARPPGSLKKQKYTGGSDVSGISIKGSHDNSTFPAGPKATAGNVEPRSYDSWRPS